MTDEERQIDEDEEIEIDLLFEAIRRKYGYDFRDYARASARRRVRHRMAVSGLGSISEMQRRILVDPEFADTFLKDLSINVTEMFRDPDFYVALREIVVPVLSRLTFVHVWHAGCATGEEVYSMAILLREEGLSENCRVYATDYNQAALQKAREGIFPLDRMRQYVGNYQAAGGREEFADYYTARYDGAIMDPALRKNVVFSNHDLARDGAFAEMDLIVCRNVLIYFNKDLQERVIDLFSSSLSEGGFLCLGAREMLRPGRKDEFGEVCAKRRIFRKLRQTRRDRSTGGRIASEA